MRKIIIISILFIIIIMPLIEAIGIAGSELVTKVDFEPGLEITRDYIISTDSPIEQDYKLYGTGIFEDNIIFEPPILSNIKPGEQPIITVKITLPDEAPEPGLHGTRICVGETTTPGEGQISALAAICALLKVRVLYPGKYIRATFEAKDAAVYEPVNFKINVENWGKEKIHSVWAEISVYESNNKELTKIKTEPVEIESAGKGLLTASLDTIGWMPGEYTAKASISYDGDLITKENKFRIGELFVEITNHTAIVPYNQLSPFDIIIQSGWNNPMNNVYAEIMINGQTITTPTGTLKPWETKTITAYWDTTGLELGEYEATINLHYEGKITIKRVKIEIQEVKKSIIKPLGTLDTTTLVIILLGILVAANMFWFMYLQKKTK